MTREQFALALMRYCLHLDASVTQWGCTTHYSRLLGREQPDAHHEWLAADVIYDDIPSVSEREVLAGLLELRVDYFAYHDTLTAASFPRG